MDLGFSFPERFSHPLGVVFSFRLSAIEVCEARDNGPVGAKC